MNTLQLPADHDHRFPALHPERKEEAFERLFAAGLAAPAHGERPLRPAERSVRWRSHPADPPSAQWARAGDRCVAGW